MRRGSGANLLEWDDSLALENSVESVCFYVLGDVSCTRRPADFDAVDFGRGAQTKVHAEITLREIASTTPDLVGLRDAARGKFDSHSDGQTVAFGPSQFQADPMTAHYPVITKNHGCAIDVFHYHIELSVVEQISDRQPARRPRLHQRGSSLVGGVTECAISLVQLKHSVLSIAAARSRSRDAVVPKRG